MSFLELPAICNDALSSSLKRKLLCQFSSEGEELEDMTHGSSISLPGSSLSPVASLTKTDTSVSYYNDSRADVPLNDRSLKDESESSTNGCSLQQHESCDGNGCVDSEMWFPPEPEDQEDDIEDSVANFSDDMKGSQPSNLSNLGDKGSGSFRSEKELIWEMLATKRAEFKKYLEPILNFLGVSGSANDGGDTWADTITDLSWTAVSYLIGYSVDPSVYVKVKCVATGHRDESEVFEGLAFSKEAAHKHMPPKSIEPKFLLIRGVSYDGLSSFESMKQEKESIDYYMGMIEKLNPKVVLVEKTVSHDIQESIIAKGMTLVLGMKQRLEKIACHTGSPILSSDKLLNDQKLGQCKSLYFVKIKEEHASLCENGKRPIKTIMFLEGCPTEMGLTILLKGSNIHELKKIKKVVGLAVLMAYAWIRASLLRLREPVTVKTISSNSNKDLNNDGITAMLDSGRMPVLISRQNATRETSCLPDIKFHQNIDIPLDIFLLDDLFNQKLLCGTCNELPEAHISCYAHRDKKLTVEVKRLPPNEQLPGENEGKLWMWSYCGKCNGSLKSAKRELVSVGPHGVSFGKILEHVFSNICGWETPLSCGHFYYGDYLHFYGLGSMVVLFRFSTERTYSVSLSLGKVEFSNSSEVDLLQKEFKKVLEEGLSVFTKVAEFLKDMENKSVGRTVNIEGSDKKYYDAQKMLKQERDQFENKEPHCSCMLSMVGLSSGPAVLTTGIRAMAEGKIKIDKFDGQDFGFWKIQIEDYLYQKKLHQPLTDTRPTGMNWDLLDRQTLGVVQLSLSKNVAYNIVNEKTTFGLLKTLGNMYEKVSASYLVYLLKRLVNLNMKEGGSVTEYINEFNNALSRLQAVDMMMDNQMQACLLLGSLPESWSGTVVAMSSSRGSAKLTFSEVRDTILSEEIRRKTAGETPNSLLSTETKGRSEKKKKSGGRGRSKSRNKG